MKMIYERDMTMNWETLLFFKSLVSIVTLIAYTNKDVVSYLKVAKHDQTFLTLRIILSTIGNMSNTYAPQYLP